MLPEWKKKIIEENRGKKVAFVHAPKCAGSFVNRYCQDLGIKSLGHNQATNDPNTFYFSVIRDPVSRFESFLNFRLGHNNKFTFRKQLHHVFHKKSITLNQIVNKMNRSDMQRFKPYRTLEYWIKGCHILITIDELFDFFRELGHEHFTIYAKENVSPKLRGKLNEKNIQRLKNIFKKDMEIYQKWTRSD